MLIPRGRADERRKEILRMKFRSEEKEKFFIPEKGKLDKNNPALDLLSHQKIRNSTILRSLITHPEVFSGAAVG